MENKKQIRHALETLVAINQFFDHNNPVHPGALVMDDDRTIQEHVKEAISDLFKVTS